MPSFILHYNSPNIESKVIETLQNNARSILSQEIGKSSDFVLTVINFCENMSFGDSSSPCAFAEVKNVGKLDASITTSMSDKLCCLISDSLGISKERIYIEFQESDRHLWGWNGKTFQKS
tara:strand:+ start:251 stop:610 length:360 start_codon:yes stop_codon:yes gene_type:complete